MKKLYLSIGIFAMSCSAYSADLSEIFKQSEMHDPQLSAAKSTLDAITEGKKQAFAAFLPQINAGWSVSEGESTTVISQNGLSLPLSPRVSDGKSWNVGLTQSLYDHANYQQYRIADLQILKSSADYDIAYQDFVLRVAQNYFNVLAAQDSLIFSKAEEKAIQRQLDQAEQRYEVGLAAITDVHEARARFDSARASVILANNTLQDANEALFEMSQEYYEELKQVPNDIDYSSFMLNDMESYQSSGLEQNPELISSRINADISEKQISVSRAGHFPTLSLSISRSNSFNPNTVTTQIDEDTGLPVQLESGDRTTNSNSISINLNVPIYSGGRTASQVRQSAHQHNAAMDRYEQSRRGTIRKIRNSYNGTLAAKSSVEARKQAMVSAQSGLEATEAGYEVGTRTIVDVLLSQRSFYQSQRDYSQAKYDYFIKLLSLKRASGILHEQDILAINKVLRN